MAGTLARIKEYIDSKGMSVRKFEESVGFSNGSFASQLKNDRTIGSDKIENILQTYPDLNPAWLLTGKGKMLTGVFTSDQPSSFEMKERPQALNDQVDNMQKMVGSSKEESPVVRDDQNKELVAYKSEEGGIPLIPLEAFAGFGTDNSAQIMEYECETYFIPVFRGAEFLIQVKGSSMYPKYASGDMVACKKLPLDTFFQWNKVYVLDTMQGVLIKRIKRGADADHITIVSENKQYEPFELHRSAINSLAIVVGVIRLE